MGCCIILIALLTRSAPDSSMFHAPAVQMSASISNDSVSEMQDPGFFSNSGLNLSAYYINLKTRTDRRHAIEKQLLSTGLSILRVDAVDVRQNDTALQGCWDEHDRMFCAGKIGCKSSHIIALNLGEESGAQAIAIFEDDFAWQPDVDPRRIGYILSFVEQEFPEWKVVGLSQNILEKRVVLPERDVETSLMGRSTVIRVTNAQTTHGYVVKASYAPTLKKVFDECQVNKRYDIAIDQCWKSLQVNDEWYGFSPQLGTQMPGYSDIESRFVDYNISRRSQV
jgi:GR25 family glycosyltransferase involved in LPS biosynthesis